MPGQGDFERQRLSIRSPQAADKEQANLDEKSLSQLVRQTISGRRASKAITQHAKSAGLTETELCVLWSLYHYAPVLVSQRELAEHLQISTAHISVTVTELDHAELISGQRDPQDRRRQCWQLTPAGRQRLSIADTGLAPRPSRREAA